MLRQETVEKRTLDLIKLLMKDDVFMSFNLVGGTALALKLGHRKSIDIDLFTTSDFSSSDIASHLASTYQAKRIQTITNGVFCFVKGIKIDLLTHKYPFLENIATIDGVRMISLIDIGSMKLNAIYDNGSRLKDFIDLYILLEHYSLKELLEANEKKIPRE